jgi:predicted TIM-barrel fold metal-dependent hydrolase
MKAAALLAYLALAACAAAAPPASGPAPAPSPAALSGAPPAAEDFRPLADHHIHLLSPAAAALATPPLLPEVPLPPDLAAVLHEREVRRNDQKALAEIYTEDAFYYRGGTVGWARGREAAAGSVRWTISDWPYRIAPVAFSRTKDAAEVATYFMEGKALDQRFASSLLSLRKGADGKWRIAAESYVFEDRPRFEKAYTAADLIAKMDAVGTRRGAVLSSAYYYDSVRPEPVPDEYAKVRADNDWTAEQVASFPDRLVAFCSFNPLREYAPAELERCASSGRFAGIKLHFNAAQLDFHSPEQIAKVRAVMATANARRLPMIIHVRPGNVYGRGEAEAFLRELVAAAPDVPIQIAHLWGGESYSAEALAVYAEAIAAGDPRTRNLYFDLSGVTRYAKAGDLPEIAARIRQIGLERMLYGSDAPPAEAWEQFRKLPLTDAELRTIAGNVAPYLR